ncbi:MAG: hypothetical protein JSV65_15095 [Armatimonadota bacterium]|nr:MAG: hypothetical protein JSV65_15095 [Armatimonadota bacterium]
MAAGRERKASPVITAGAAHIPHAGVGIYAGLFCVTLSTLMLEILLTRIFSVILWYHFAFVAVSVALFGMTLGAVIVHLAPRYFSGPRIPTRLAGAAGLFGLTTAAATVVMLRARFSPPTQGGELAALVPLYLLVAVPFTFSGIVVSVALTRFPQRINRLYAVDLIGAAVGCSGVIFTLDLLDAPSALIAVGAAAALGSLFFSLGSRALSARVAAGALVVALAAMAVYSGHGNVLRVRWAKGARQPQLLYEKWNAFSRVMVCEYADRPNAPPGEGPGQPFGVYGRGERRQQYQVDQLWMDIDANAATVMTRFDGNLKAVGYLPYDVSAAAHWLRPNASVMVIGVGGGRDILTALAMNQRSVTGVELNESIVTALNDRFGEFTGHLDHNPRVRFITDEARSWIERSPEEFDIIQCALIDTWAATAAGAFVLSENNLYTEQAWTAILNHLTDRGVFSVTRWYFYRTPGEILRCLSLARATLEGMGVRDCRRHLAVVALRVGPGPYGGNGMGTVLISRSPLTDDDVRRLETWAQGSGFEVMLSPATCKERRFARLLAAPRLRDFTDGFPLDVTPPTDDRPFFLQMLRFRDWAAPRPPGNQGTVSMNLQAVSVLGSLLTTTTVLAVLFVLVPLGLTYRRDRYSLRSLAPGLLFFAAIGLGFMLVEISQMQRLIIFLGHPTYGLSVVLLVLLGAGGLGSLVGGGISLDDWRAMRRIAVVMGTLLVLLAVFGLITPALTRAAQPAPMPQRILLAVALLAPIAFFMGTPFPLGMKLASRGERAPTAWYWGINGAMSVVASVAAVALALVAGITVAFFAGIACYACAAVALVWLSRRS